jgi:hypothetical protein
VDVAVFAGLARFADTRNGSAANVSWRVISTPVALLRDAESSAKDFSARFMQVDLTKLPAFKYQLLVNGNWSLVTAFAVLHHIPSREIRLDILNTIYLLLKPNGRFIQSNWQFLNSEKLRSRIQDWSKAGISPEEVDPNDYLLDWRSGGEGLRYVHHYDEGELQELAAIAGFQIKDTFYSDGEGGKLGLYQVWNK